MCINLTVDNWLKIISLIFGVIGGFFVYYQWRKSVKTKRAEFINQILEKLRFNKDLSKYMHIIDYNQDWYDESFHRSGDISDIEISIDNLFSYVDYICYLKATRNISKSEFKIFKYEIDRICVSHSTKCYLWNLYHFSKKNKSTCSFQYLIDYGISCGLFPKDFKNNNSLYTKRINW